MFGDKKKRSWKYIRVFFFLGFKCFFGNFLITILKEGGNEIKLKKKYLFWDNSGNFM